jgi:hypothetical protein
MILGVEVGEDAAHSARHVASRMLVWNATHAARILSARDVKYSHIASLFTVKSHASGFSPNSGRPKFQTPTSRRYAGYFPPLDWHSGVLRHDKRLFALRNTHLVTPPVSLTWHLSADTPADRCAKGAPAITLSVVLLLWTVGTTGIAHLRQ